MKRFSLPIQAQSTMSEGYFSAIIASFLYHKLFTQDFIDLIYSIIVYEHLSSHFASNKLCAVVFKSNGLWTIDISQETRTFYPFLEEFHKMQFSTEHQTICAKHYKIISDPSNEYRTTDDCEWKSNRIVWMCLGRFKTRVSVRIVFFSFLCHSLFVYYSNTYAKQQWQQQQRKQCTTNTLSILPNRSFSVANIHRFKSNSSRPFKAR